MPEKASVMPEREYRATLISPETGEIMTDTGWHPWSVMANEAMTMEDMAGISPDTFLYRLEERMPENTCPRCGRLADKPRIDTLEKGPLEAPYEEIHYACVDEIHAPHVDKIHPDYRRYYNRPISRAIRSGAVARLIARVNGLTL